MNEVLYRSEAVERVIGEVVTQILAAVRSGQLEDGKDLVVQWKQEDIVPPTPLEAVAVITTSIKIPPTRPDEVYAFPRFRRIVGFAKEPR